MNVAIIQARMGSTRLPGKVLKNIFGKPLIGYVIDAVRHIKDVDKIVVATTDSPIEKPLVDYVQEQGVSVFRGSEEDVLARYYFAAVENSADQILRITSDCPLLDPIICSGMIDYYYIHKFDYCRLAPEFAEGLDCEIFSFDALKRAYLKAKLKSEREHVSLHFHNKSIQFKMGIYPNKTDNSNYRFTVDEPEDFEVVRIIIENLYKGKPIKAKEVLSFLADNPEIFSINQQIIRNEGLMRSLQKESSS